MSRMRSNGRLARRAFLNLKKSCLAAAEGLPQPRATRLRLRIRQAATPAELWPLRAAVVGALPATAPGATGDA